MSLLVVWSRGSLLAIALFLLVGCSFHSSQYEFVKSLVLKKEKEESGPKKNWVIEWNELRTPVYAVNGPGYVLFTDESGVLLKYQNFQIIDVEGLLSKESAKEIAVSVTKIDDGVKLGYRFQGESTSEVHSCSLWIPPTENINKEPNVSMWVQNCSHLTFKYQNRRWLNEMGQLIRLEYLLKRDYPHANIFLL